jgi:hypothetical protein
MAEQRTAESLVREAENLEGLARQAQREDAAEESLLALRERYRRWYEEVLLVLPEEASGRFREQYEGSLVKPRIKQFVREPQKKWALHDWMPKSLQGHGKWQYPLEASFLEPFHEQRYILAAALRRTRPHALSAGAVDLLTDMARRLPTAIRFLGRERRGRAGLPIDDEYDLQRLLHALLSLHFDDVRPEETTPSKAGGSYRIDFLLKQERLAVEAKMTNPSLTPAKVRDQLVSDIFGYQRHGDVDGFFALVYDPDRRIDSPRGFEDDLNDPDPAFPVRVVVSPG